MSLLPTLIPGLGIFKGMAHGFRRLLSRKATIQYPEEIVDISPKHRGRLILLYDEYGALKCETCFQCAQACPIEIIDMGGVDTKGRYHVHWGPPEQYAERREDSALRRSGRPVPDQSFVAYEAIDLTPLDRILDDVEYDPRHMLTILERTQEAYGYLPVAAFRHISSATGAWYSEIYGIASALEQFRLEPPGGHVVGLCRCANCTLMGGGRLREALEAGLETNIGGVSPDGKVRFEAADCHGESRSRPYLKLNGVAQDDTTPAGASLLARRLRGAGVPAEA